MTRRTWWRVLLAVLGGSELLMAASAAPAVFLVGSTGGLALVAAAFLADRRGLAAGLLGVGTVPFAVAAWTALVPIAVALLAAAVALPVLRPR